MQELVAQLAVVQLPRDIQHDRCLLEVRLILLEISEVNNLGLHLVEGGLEQGFFDSGLRQSLNKRVAIWPVRFREVCSFASRYLWSRRLECLTVV